MGSLTTETWVFLAVIAGGTLLAHARFTLKTAHEAPGLLITIGIFATFFGIASGLYHFNMDNVETSLPQLILGIKLAFWASVAGVGGALTVKVRFALFGVKEASEAPTEGATIDDLVIHLKASARSLDRLQQAMVGDEDSTLLTQLKLIRTDQNDKLDTLRRAFVEFAEKQAENNSKALIEALKEVITDFNVKINEQFGDNFKQLNEAVGRINDWQEQYRLQMSEMIEQQTATASNMEAATRAFSEVLQNAKSFTSTADDLKNTIGFLAAVEDSLRANLTALATLVESARTGIPTIQTKVLEIVTDIGAGAKASADLISKQVTKSASDLATAIQLQNDVITQTIKQLSTQVAQALQKHNEEIGRNVTDLTQKTQQQVLTLDAELSRALKTSLETLGQQLGALSNKFVQDYGPLTEQLRLLVQTANRIQH